MSNIRFAQFSGIKKMKKIELLHGQIRKVYPLAYQPARLKRRGFSLVEVIVVIVIISISAGIVLRSTDTAQKAKTALEIEGRKLSAAIASQRNDALAGKKMPGAASNCEYVITPSADGLSYAISGCSESRTVVLAPPIRFRAKPTIAFTNSPMLNVKVNGAPLLPSGQTSFGLFMMGVSLYNITVSGTGNITDGF